LDPAADGAQQIGSTGKPIGSSLVKRTAQAILQDPKYAALAEKLSPTAVSPELYELQKSRGKRLPVDECCAAVVLGNGTRLRTFVALIADQVLRRQEKAIVWVAYPATQKLIVSLMAVLNIASRAFLATLDATERGNLVRAFNNEKDPLRVLICNYVCSPAGYNLQQACRYVHLLDPPPSKSAREQAVGRTHRLGQKTVVVVVSYICPEVYAGQGATNSAHQLAAATLGQMERRPVLDAFGWPGMTAAEEERVLGWRGFFVLGSEVVHEAHPRFGQLQAAAIIAGKVVKEASALDIAVRVSDEGLGVRTEVDVGRQGRFKVVSQADVVGRMMATAEEYQAEAMREVLAAENDQHSAAERLRQGQPEALTTPRRPAAHSGPTPRTRAAPKTLVTPAAGRKCKAAEPRVKEEEEEDDGLPIRRQKKKTAG
jgi:hypothetical protein